MLDAGPTLVLLASAFAGAFVMGFSGFAFTPVAAVGLLATLPPREVLPLLMISSLLVQGVAFARLRHGIQFDRTRLMLLGGAAGVPLALLLFEHIDARSFQVGFGGFLAVYALAMLSVASARARIARAPGSDLAVGFLGGLVGAVTAMPGALPVLYCDLQGLGKQAQRAIVQPFILAMQVLALLFMAVRGDLTANTAGLVAIVTPALAVGCIAGIALFGLVPERAFRQVVLSLLLISGAALIVCGPAA